MTANEFLDSLEIEAAREKTSILQADFARLLDSAARLAVLEAAYKNMESYDFSVVVKAIFGTKQEEGKGDA